MLEMYHSCPEPSNFVLLLFVCLFVCLGGFLFCFCFCFFYLAAIHGSLCLDSLAAESRSRAWTYMEGFFFCLFLFFFS